MHWREWNQYAHMEVLIFEDGGYGAIAKIIDPPGNLATGKGAEAAFPILLMNTPGNSADPNEDGWTAWQKPADYDRFLTATPYVQKTVVK